MGLAHYCLSLQIFMICKCVFKSMYEFSNMQEMALVKF